jgi:MT0933-like antitoxin protein
MGLKDNMEGKLSEHGDQAKTGVDKAGDMVDKKTGGKHADKVDAAQDKARGMIDDRGDEQSGEGSAR